jgi:hypothetical protein
VEIIVGIVVVFILLIVIGKMIGAPDPASMSEAAILQRLHTEGSWISKYLSQPIQSQQSESLKKMYVEKTAYIENLKRELNKRQMARGVQAVQTELEPIMQRTAALMKEGKSETEANALALKEWAEKNK